MGTAIIWVASVAAYFWIGVTYANKYLPVKIKKQIKKAKSRRYYSPGDEIDFDDQKFWYILVLFLWPIMLPIEWCTALANEKFKRTIREIEDDDAD